MQLTSLRRGRGPGHARVRGVGLLEVLIAVLVLGVGLLGIAALQANALKNNQSSMERSQAVMQTYAIIDRMRANANEAKIGRYNLNNTCSAPTGATLALNDLNAWMTSLQGALGTSACSTIVCSTTDCSVTVKWDDSRGTRGSSAQTVTTVTVL